MGETTAGQKVTHEPRSDRARIQPGREFREFQKAWTESSLVECFERQVRESPQRLAVKSGAVSWTYEELNQNANRLARQILQPCGQESGPVAFLLQRGASEIMAIVGILKAAKFYVPLDPAYPRARLLQVLDDVQPRAVVTDKKRAGLAQELSSGRFRLINIDELGPHSADNLNLPASADDNAYVLFTSSSTGRAKGVVHKQRAVLHQVMKVTNTLCLDPSDRLGMLAACSFIASSWCIFGSLLNGAAVFPFSWADPGLLGLADWLKREAITTYQSAPTMFRRFVQTLNGQTFPNLRVIRLGGEPITRRDVELCRTHFAPSCVLEVVLGATEMTPIRQIFFDHETPLEGTSVPVGYATSDTEVIILDEHKRPLESNQVGEIAVKSRYLAEGYWNDPALTRQLFLPDPAGSDEQTYLTGDLGLLRSDGCLEYHGRKDFQVQIRGHRVEVAEVEMALMELDSIKEAAVTAREDRPGEQRLVAYIVPKGEAPSVSEMRYWLSTRLPSFMMPSAFVVLDSLPLTETGKIARLALPPPSTSRPALRAAYRQPSDPSQYLLAELWAELLHTRPIGVGDDFFELGGDSLLAVSLLTRIEESFGRAVPQATFMERPTIEGLSQALLEQDARRSQPMLVRLMSTADPMNKADQQPLVYVHGDFNGGGYYCYHLAKQLKENRPLYLLHPHGVFSPQLPVTIEAMAADNVQTLLSEIEGPYALGGHCNGAMVALEMARQLRARGQTIQSLVIIAPPEIQPRVAGGSGQSEPVAALAADRFDMARVVPGTRRTFLLEAYRRIVAAYRPAPYDGMLTILQPAESGPLPDFWRQMGREVQIRTIAGGHLTSITQHAAALAAELDRCLQNGDP